jgi:hypothetical protein
VPDTIKTQILANLITAIEGVTEANGYNRTVRAVAREAKDLNTPERDLVFVSSQHETKGRPLLNNKVEVVLHIGIACVVEERNDLAKAVDNIAADVEKAICTDVSRGTLAIDTVVTRTEDHVVADLEPLGSSVMEVEITFRHAFGNPYST